MTSPRDIPVLSSSPISVRGSPIARRRRDSGSQSDSVEPSSRARQPVYPLSLDHNDPDSRERQRAMDVDMALQLSRARRETMVSPSHYEPPLREEMEPSFLLNTSEQHAFGIAHDDGIHPLDQDVSGVSEEPLHAVRPADAELSNLDQARNHALLDTPEGRYNPAHHEDASTSMTGLPSYHANSFRSVFDFNLLESFSSEEKANQGTTFGSEPPPFRHNKPAEGQVGDAGQPSSQTDLSKTGIEPSNAQSPPNLRVGGRHRKLSQSSPIPRSHRRVTRGKMVPFDHRNEPVSRFPAHLMAEGQLSTVPSSDNLSTICQPYAPENINSVSGIMAPVDDRPYRFSFYSNSLSATIHARNLSELPAEGQSFQDLFTGISIPSEGSTFKGGPLGRQSNSGSNRRSEKPPGDPGKPIGSSGGDYEASTWWLDVLSPTDEEMNVLSKVFGIHPLTTEDIQMEETREKIELFRNYYLVCFRSFDQDPYGPTYLEPLNMYIVVFREGILSFHFRPTPHPQNVRRRIKQLKDYINVTSDWISYALIDDITDAFGPLIQSIEYEVDSIDELVLILKDTEQSDMLRRIGLCRRKVLGLLRLMGSKADVVKGLAKRCNENWRVAPTSDIGLYLSDIQDHLITMTQNLNHYEKILSRSHSNYLAQISIEMTDANNQINDVLSKLTALGTILIPMNLVTGLWGMNVHVPGQDITEGYAWFSSIVAALAAFAVIGGYTTYKFMRR
ncbi:hypothetical protein BKA82DRAFT_4157639 [Pisolithus tinctorius]|nr:hypothetical protein BKA82DRAFT_4157639 [Pisolithus tinctorius]